MIPFVIMYLRMYSKIIIHISSPCSCNEKTDPNLASTKKTTEKLGNVGTSFHKMISFSTIHAPTTVINTMCTLEKCNKTPEITIKHSIQLKTV